MSDNRNEVEAQAKKLLGDVFAELKNLGAVPAEDTWGYGVNGQAVRFNIWPTREFGFGKYHIELTYRGSRQVTQRIKFPDLFDAKHVAKKLIKAAEAMAEQQAAYRRESEQREAKRRIEESHKQKFPKWCANVSMFGDKFRLTLVDLTEAQIDAIAKAMSEARE